jgi:hypothetical protein
MDRVHALDEAAVLHVLATDVQRNVLTVHHTYSYEL